MNRTGMKGCTTIGKRNLKLSGNKFSSFKYVGTELGSITEKQNGKRKKYSHTVAAKLAAVMRYE